MARRKPSRSVFQRFLPSPGRTWTEADVRWLAVELAAYRDAVAAAEQLLQEADLWDRWRADGRTRGLWLLAGLAGEEDGGMEADREHRRRTK